MSQKFIEIAVPAEFKDDELTTFEAVEQAEGILPASPVSRLDLIEALRALHHEVCDVRGDLLVEALGAEKLAQLALAFGQASELLKKLDA